MLSNNYLFTNLSQCTMKYQIYAAPSPLKGQQSLLASGEGCITFASSGETGRAVIQKFLKISSKEMFFNRGI